MKWSSSIYLFIKFIEHWPDVCIIIIIIIIIERLENSIYSLCKMKPQTNLHVIVDRISLWKDINFATMQSYEYYSNGFSYQRYL